MLAEISRLQDPNTQCVALLPLAEDNKFWMFAQAMNKAKRTRTELVSHYSDVLFAIDPGETTGCCIWSPKTNELYLFQLETPSPEEGWRKLRQLMMDIRPAHIRVEDYRVYGHMTEQHSYASLHTPQLIGAIRAAVYELEMEMSVAMAAHAKTFWTDGKLKMCNLYHAGLKHARDAQRHMLRYMCE